MVACSGCLFGVLHQELFRIGQGSVDGAFMGKDFILPFSMRTKISGRSRRTGLSATAWYKASEWRNISSSVRLVVTGTRQVRFVR